MEDLTGKIGSAIKKKLIEMNVMVEDNELSEYIMILVANKRSKSHMQRDLSLFLKDDTAKFIDWLFDMVNELKTNSTSVSEDQGNKVTVKTEMPAEDDADVLYLREQETELLDEIDAGSGKNSQKEQAKEKGRVVGVAVPSAHALAKSGTDSKKDRRSKLASKVLPVKPLLSSKDISDCEYDPTRPDISNTVSSVITEAQKIPKPYNVKPNKLLLRAVDDATKSVLHDQEMDDFYKPTPIKLLTSSRKDNAVRTRNLISVPIVQNFSSSTPTKRSPQLFEPENTFEKQPSLHLGEEVGKSYAPTHNRTIHMLSEDIDFEDIDYIKAEPDEPDPHFIVTLDGVSLPTRKRKLSEESMEVDGDEFELNEFGESEEEMHSKRPKFAEKCKFWPSCKNNDCAYHHPSIPCKLFPNCKYGDQCFFVHPNCKFDALCSKKTCPFTHLTKPKFFAIRKPYSKVAVPKPVCKFYPKCTAKNCPFIHPRLCRFGTKCNVPACPFTHSDIPSRKQLVWKASEKQVGD